ncbi:SNARE domain-containing protein [Cryptosporidium felis]|nr:SNARE domain-containing protein [Cryptosporidium felis]
MTEKNREKLPYFGNGKKVVFTLLFLVSIWIYGLISFGFNPEDSISKYWLLELNLKPPNDAYLKENIHIVVPKRKEYGDLSCNIMIKLERWLISSLNLDDLESMNGKMDALFLSEKLVQKITFLVKNKDFDTDDFSPILIFEDDSGKNNTIKFKLKNRSRGFINFEIINKKKIMKVEDLITTKNGIQYFPIRTIGYCYSCWTEKFGIPKQGTLVPDSRGVIQLLPEFNSDFIFGLNEFSHLWVIFIFNDVAENNQAGPMIRPPNLEGKATGVYSTRTPHRLNRIGISNVKIDSILGNLIYVSGLDLLNETPIIDIKPYHICDIINKNELTFPKWVTNNLEDVFQVLIPNEIIEKLSKLTRMKYDDILTDSDLCRHRKKLQKFKHFGGEWPFIFFKSQEEFIKTVTQCLSHDVRCRSRKIKERYFSLNFLDEQISEETVLGNEHVDLKTSQGIAEIEMKNVLLPPLWVDLHIEAQEELLRVKELLSYMQKTQQKRMIPILEDRNTKNSECEMDSMTISVCDSFKRIESIARSISNPELKVKSKDGYSVNEDILKRNAEISIANNLNPLMKHFKSIQNSYIKKIQSSENHFSEDVKQENSLHSFKFEEKFLTDHNNELDLEGITNITRNIAELNSIFKEMSLIVIEQGSIVDRIDFNVDNTLLRINNAHKQIIRAEKSYKNKFLSKLINLLVVSIIIEIIIILVKLIY